MGLYTNQSATAIALDILTTYAPDFDTSHIQADLPVIDEIQFTNTSVADAISQIAKRIGGQTYLGQSSDVHLFLDADTLSSEFTPTPLTSDHPTLEALEIATDATQFVSRVRVEGGGPTLLAAVEPGETILPVEDATWFAATGGRARIGPQEVTYTGRALGGGGSLVGPGVGPAAAPTAALAAGSGIETGAHDYAVTFATASGESIAGPSATIDVGTLSAPSSAPSAASPTAGNGPDPGTHLYGVTFVTAAGETTAGPTVSKATSVTAAPSSALTVGTPTAGGSVDAGDHDYIVTFVNSAGETTAGPTSSVATAGGVVSAVDPPSSAPTAITSDVGNINAGYHFWACTYVSPSGETTLGAVYPEVGSFAYDFSRTLGIPTSPSGYVTARRLYRTKSDTPTMGSGTSREQFYLVATINDNTTTEFVDNVSDGSLGANPPATNTASLVNNTIPLSNIPIGGAGVTARRIYRRISSTFKLVTTINDNSTTTYSDTTADASLGSIYPTTNTAAAAVISLSNIPIGPTLVTARKIYGTAAGSSQLKLITTIADNSTTTYNVSTPDASLGANVPTSNTAAANQVSLSAIPIGAASVTARKVYRTTSGGSQLKLVDTIADNTTTTYTDSTADASLGANVPSSDTSGLTQPAGQVLPGETTIPVAGPGGFPSAGWAVIGNGQQAVRYTGKSGTSLTGIPSSGTGAIIAAVSYNSTITAAPQLTGVPGSGAGAVLYAVPKGQAVRLVVIVTDADAQVQLAALTGTDGLREHILTDGRLSYTEAEALALAYLAQYGHSITTIRYRTRDKNTRAGRTVAVSLVYPKAVSGSFKIQQVTITNFEPALFPYFTAVASDELYTFEQLLRFVRGEGR